jgi:AraC-like DNA-binding protein
LTQNHSSGGSDRPRGRVRHPDDRMLGLAATNPIAHQYAGPLFKAGVAFVCFAEYVNHQRGPQPDKHHWIYIVLEGQMLVTVGNRRKQVVGPGEICVVPEGTVWGRKGVTEKLRCIMFSLRCVPRWKPLCGRGAQIRDYDLAASMNALVVQLLNYFELGTVADRRSAQGVAKAILSLLEEEVGPREIRPSAYADKLASLFSAIRAEPAADWTLARMTEETGLPVRTLTRHCQRVYGTSPYDLVHRQRLIIACDLMTDGTSLEEVAPLVGYADPASFSNMFHRHMDMRPGEYTRRQRAE